MNFGVQSTASWVSKWWCRSFNCNWPFSWLTITGSGNQALMSNIRIFGLEYLSWPCRIRIRVSGYSSNPNRGFRRRIFEMPFTAVGESAVVTTCLTRCLLEFVRMTPKGQGWDPCVNSNQRTPGSSFIVDLTILPARFLSRYAARRAFRMRFARRKRHLRCKATLSWTSVVTGSPNLPSCFFFHTFFISSVFITLFFISVIITPIIAAWIIVVKK